MKYEVQTIETTEGVNYRITEKATDSRIATCYVKDNADLVCKALNKLDEPILTKVEHNPYPFKIGDKVTHAVDRAPFIVTGVRLNEVRILGDWSGGTQPYLGQGEDWVHIREVKSI
jgi:hypothetical protein